MERYLSYLLPAAHPVLFNTWKHHLLFLRAKLLMAEQKGEEVLEHHIYKIGHNLMDLYTGHFTPQQITEKIFLTLPLMNVMSADSYYKWLMQQDEGYVNLKIEDGSVWTLLPGRGEQYIHIHPARYSPHTIRVKALSLKTALWLSYELLQKPEMQLDTDFINMVRKKRLQASPIRSGSVTYHLNRLTGLILGSHSK